MPKLIDLIGERFGRLIVLERVASDRAKNPRWLCLCGCGKEKIILGYNLKNGNTKSCGCLSREIHLKHGYSAAGKVSKTYTTWQSMIQRCINPNNIRFYCYGGRGIKVCKRWTKFENFLEDMGEHPGKKYQLDRINNNGNYCKSNCRWATRKEQARNTSRNRLISYDGKTQCVAAWAEEYNINYSTLWYRIYESGWSIKKALTTPVKKRRK